MSRLRMLRITIGIAVLRLVLPQSALAEEPVDFRLDVRPILSDNCFRCHGPDDNEAGLRLNDATGLFEETESGAVPVVPGDLEGSELYWRITSTDPIDQMPPPRSGLELSSEEITVLTNWIKQGAPFEEHWAFTPPLRPMVPKIAGPTSARNPIDLFVLARLEDEGLAPAPEADRNTLIRRLSLDIVGLPPSVDQVTAFLNDMKPGAYERLVDQMLASPHHGELQGRRWLDAARYADSDGFEKDKPRVVWPYRDWVVDAINRDLPYDQFIVEQIAGDLLPNPSQDQLVATGFLRNSMINEEGGVDPEQFRMEAMFDRMDALGKAVLGLTIQCAQCHTHKYDPISQREYYEMFAFLNNSYEASMTVYTKEEQAKRNQLFSEIAELETNLKQDFPDWPERLQRWEDEQIGRDSEWQVIQPETDLSGGQKHIPLPDGSILAQGYAPSKISADFKATVSSTPVTGLKLEVLNSPNLPHGGPGRAPNGLFALTEFEVRAGPADGSAKPTRIKIAAATAEVNPPENELAAIFDDKSGKRRVTGPIDYAIDGDQKTAWGIDIGPGRSNVSREAVFVFKEPVSFESGTVFTFKLVQNHGGWNSNDNQSNNLGRFRFLVTNNEAPVADPVPDAVRTVLAIDPEDRAPQQLNLLFSYFRTTIKEWSSVNLEIESLWKSHPEGTSQLVLQARENPRTTYVLDRGDFLKPTEPVDPGVPSFLHSLENAERGNRERLVFARWLVDRDAPTTARSIVNRVWQGYFGVGLVETSEDLGSQASPPSHPELLDWLAVELMESDWSLKHLHRLIITSATYRQSSQASIEQYQRDPKNRLLARGPRFRVDAEIVRDFALSAAGLLNPRVGGPSVYSPAPEFLFLPPESYGTKVWNTTDEDRYRRALYTFRYRSVPFPILDAFDAPPGNASCVRRSRSNTPLQALVTLNEPVFLDAARGLSNRILEELGPEASPQDRLNHAFQICLSRPPSESETEVLLNLLEQQFSRFHSSAADLASLLAGNRSKPSSSSEASGKETSDAERAAWTVVSRVLLNLDETLTKE